MAAAKAPANAEEKVEIYIPKGQANEDPNFLISVNGVNKGEFSFAGPKDGSLDGYVEIGDIPFAAGDTVKVTVHPDPEKTKYVQEDSSFTATAE